jgi:hypothetical protein
MLCSRSWAGRRLTLDAFHQIKERTPLRDMPMPGTGTSMKGLPKWGEGDNEEEPVTAKHQFFMTARALILSAGVANAGPCNTGQTTR